MNAGKTWLGVDRRMGRGRSNLFLGAKWVYVWLLQSLALTVGLVMCMAIVRSLGGWFTTGELRLFVAGAVVGYSVGSYRLLKRKESWNRRGAEMQAEIERLRGDRESVDGGG
jgi:hypothetical protein